MSLWEKILSRGGRLELIPVGRLIKSKFNIRKDYGDLESLKESIRRRGLLQPLIVRKIGNRYEVIVGERRRKALSELAKEDPVRFGKAPCLVVEVDDREAALLSLVENIHRKSISPEEQADGVKLLKEVFGMSEEEIAEEIAVAVMEIKRLIDIYLAAKELGLTLEKKAGRWRQKVVEKTIEEKVPEVSVERKGVAEKKVEEVPVAKKVVEEKEVSVEIEEEELERELEELRSKIPFSHLMIVYSLVDSMVKRNVIDRSERNSVLRDLLKVVHEHSLRQTEVREMAKRVREAIREGKDWKQTVDSFLKERYSTVELKVKITKATYIKLEEKAEKEGKTVEEIVSEIIESTL
ncbi:MAG: hypothetical protein DRN04_07485 [Thermoprotei archaeon]|nr:MAG: hypothetical protein DRN04_07485 [Thermoprotei archaeon]